MSYDDDLNIDLSGPEANEPYGLELTAAAEISEINEISEAKKAWNSKELDQQCKEVLDDLSQNKRQWDSSGGDQDIPAIEDYKKWTLAKRKGDSNEPTRVTALHILARSKDFFSLVRKDVCRHLVRYLLDNRIEDIDGTLSAEGRNRMLILQVALIYENDIFIDCVEECLGNRFADFLDLQDNDGRNCVHHLFAWPLKRRNKQSLPKKLPKENELYLDQLRKIALKAKPEALAAADNEGNTPIHYAMHLKQCWDRGNEYFDIVKSLILRADESMVKNKTLYNNKGESPIIYGKNIIEAVRSETTKKQQATHNPVQPTKDQKPLTQVERPQSKAESRAEHQVEARGSGPTKKPQKEQSQAVGGTSQGSTYSQFQPQMRPPGKSQEMSTSTVRGKVDPNAGDAKSARGNTSSPATTESTSSKAAVLLRGFLKEHYTGTRSDLDARDLIYGRGAEGWDTNLYFDARGLQEAKKILDLIDRMEAGGFGASLSYVNIPAIRHIPASLPPVDNVGPTDRDTPLENPQLGRTDLINVFNKLRDLKVKHIWRLEVEDRQTLSHTDAAIERAIQGRASTSAVVEGSKQPISIHTWDWRKPDLSTDVIAFAAPTVKVINLYWSGNQTVLKAWGCIEGIPRLHATTGVEKIFIHASPGLETMDRMKTVIKRFKDAVKAIFPEVAFVDSTPVRKNTDKLSKVVEIQFTYHMNYKEEFLANVDTGGETSEYFSDDPSEKQHAWIDAMEKFRGALASTLTPLERFKKNRVRVALIDDGVDLGSVDMYSKIVNVTGLTFHPSDRQIQNPWHRSSGGHGTIMANMILRINPWVDLFVIKLHCGISHNQGRTISARSAAQAIHAAIDLKVQIISVSWTIKCYNRDATGISPTPNESGPSQNGFNQLQTAISEVKTKGILMFCSASDDIQTTAMKVLPYGQQPDHIFRIGAALWLGQRDSVVETPDRIDWYFPGNQVAEARNPNLQGPVKYYNGSSVGTALAAGLASLIMSLARQLQDWYTEANNISEAQVFEELAKALKDRTKMKLALDMIAKNGNYQQDKRYLPVWDIFNPVTEVLRQPKANAEVKWQALTMLVKSLCLDISI